MKKAVFVLAILLVLLCLSAYDLPPELPSSFWGEVEGGRVGQKVTTNFSGYTYTFAYQDKIVYAMNVTNGKEGQRVAFFVGGRLAGSGVYHVGTNQNLNLRLPVWRPIFPLFPVLPGGIYR